MSINTYIYYEVIFSTKNNSFHFTNHKEKNQKKGFLSICNFFPQISATYIECNIFIIIIIDLIAFIINEYE